MNWLEANQHSLTAALDEVRAMLEGRVATKPETKGTSGTALNVEEGPHEVSRATISPPAALETLCKLFGLSSFERAVLLMCAGTELDSKFASVFANASGCRAPRLPNVQPCFWNSPGRALERVLAGCAVTPVAIN